MEKPTDADIEAVAPSHDVAGLPISDGYSVRNMAPGSQVMALRLFRGGPRSAALVAVNKYYDGSGGGLAGHYSLLYVEFRIGGGLWRTAGVKVRAVEATRIAGALLRGVASKPKSSEPDRIGGVAATSTESELWGAPVTRGGYLVFVRHTMKSGIFGRTRGVEILKTEKQPIAEMLANLANMTGVI